MSPADFTLRQLLLRWLSVPLVLLWLISTAIDYNVALNAATNAYDQALFNKLLALLKQVEVQDNQVRVHLPQAALEILNSSDLDRVYYQVRGGLGNIIFGYPDLPTPRKPSFDPIYFDAVYQSHNVRVVSMQAKIGGHDILIEVARTTIKRQESIAAMLLSMAIPQVLLVLLAMLSVWYAIGRGLHPLLEIRQDITQRALSDLSPIPQSKVPQEIQPLIQSFNELIYRMGRMLASQQRFIADAAHQLRTPLAGLKAQTELALRLDNPEEIRHSLEQIHKAGKQANRLAQQLLSLARTEPEAQQPDTMKILNLVELAQAIVGDWVPTALEKNIDLGFEKHTDACFITGNALLLGEMLNNLIDNALRYTQSGGIVTVRLQTEKAQCLLVVEDNGPGIPASARELVFERFYRVLGSNQEGCGLGLAIVQEIAERHHAHVDARPGTNQSGTAICVTFPRHI